MLYRPPRPIDWDDEFEAAKEEAVDDSIDLYKEYYPNDLEYYSQEDIERVIYKDVVTGLMIFAPNITEELAGKWIAGIRRKVLKDLEPITDPLFKGELLDRNPYTKKELEPASGDDVNTKNYKNWVRKILSHYNVYKDSIKFITSVDKRGNSMTSAVYPEAETKFGEFDWRSGEGIDLNVKALKVYPEAGFRGKESGFDESEVEARIENWERDVMDFWDIRIPGFRNRVRFVNIRTVEGDRGIGAEISTMPKISFGIFDLKSLQGRVRQVPLRPDEYDPAQRAYNNWKKRVWEAFNDEIVDVEKKYYLDSPDNGNTVHMKVLGVKEPLGTFNTKTFIGKIGVNWNDKQIKENTDPDMEKLEIWKHAVHTKYPTLKDKIRFVSKDQGKHVSAEIPGQDRSYGVFDMDTLTGHVLSESKRGVTKKVFEGFVSELNDIAGIYK